MNSSTKCWCGNTKLIPFSDTYLQCASCKTLLSTYVVQNKTTRVINDTEDFYGREYWFSHQEKDLGFTNIHMRTRTDLPERCLYWLRTLLKYKPPLAKVLELGSSHGGFVALMNWAGFDASGLELSPWVVDYAHQTFEIPILLGPIEDQEIKPESLDVIVLMDVLEHLPDPAGTMRRCVQLLKPDGLLLIQTPCYPEGESYETLNQTKNPFLRMLIPDEHLCLFSQNSVRQMFEQLNYRYLYFEPALFKYDMLFIASRVSLPTHNEDEITNALTSSPSGRLVLAFLDLDDEKNRFRQKWQEAEADRAARLDQINTLTKLLQESEADRAARLEQIQELTAMVKSTQAELEATQAELDSYFEVKLRKKVSQFLKSHF